MLRTHTCGQLTKKDVGKKVTLAGWVHRRRDHGGLIFIDLRDRYGLTQIKFDPKVSKKSWQTGDQSRSEWVLQITGEVEARSQETINTKLKTGEIEVAVSEVKVLSKAKTMPFEITEEKGSEAGESIRLKYRFLDLRRKSLQKLLQKRDELITHIREFMHKRDFIDVATPILANSTPEGARDYLVPSRLYPGKFYALPQSPQQFKQLLMVGGIDRYFQIAPCFRDEDPRMDRLAEFYQLDLEMSFIEQEDIFQIIEPLMIELVEKFSNKKIINLENGRFPKISYEEAMTKYGIDRPDLRFGLEIKPISFLVKDCGFKVFAEALKQEKGVVHALKVEQGGRFSRKQIDTLTEIAREKGAKGLAYIIIKDKELHSPIVKFLGEKLAQNIVKEVEAKTGDIIFFGADTWKVVCAALGAVRLECADILGLKDPKKAAFTWVVDFPFFEDSEIEPGKIDFGHNPFSMPQGGLKALKETRNLFNILTYQYDAVLNGVEIAGGSIRNHDPLILEKAFKLVGYKKDVIQEKFGHMMKAFAYGVPPHGGIASGLDRVMLTLWDLDSIRDLYAFPKDGKSKDLMLNSPMSVDKKQLEELHLRLKI